MLNKVTLIGRLGADPDTRAFPNGGKVVNLRIATSERWKDKNSGEQRERTEWHSVAVFVEGLIGVAQRYLRKGSRVYVEGKLATRKWQDQSGADRYSTEIVLQGYDAKIVLMDRADDQAGGGDRGRSAPPATNAAPADLDDDVPF